MRRSSQSINRKTLWDVTFLSRLTFLSIVIRTQSDSIQRSRLNNGSIEDLTKIVILSSISSFFEVVMKWSVKERELLFPKFPKILHAAVYWIFPKFSDTKHDWTVFFIQRFLSFFLSDLSCFFTDVMDKVTDEATRNVLDSVESEEMRERDWVQD